LHGVEVIASNGAAITTRNFDRGETWVQRWKANFGGTIAATLLRFRIAKDSYQPFEGH
jgi:hypothetical protein